MQRKYLHDRTHARAAIALPLSPSATALARRVRHALCSSSASRPSSHRSPLAPPPSTCLPCRLTHLLPASDLQRRRRHAVLLAMENYASRQTSPRRARPRSQSRPGMTTIQFPPSHLAASPARSASIPPRDYLHMLCWLAVLLVWTGSKAIILELSLAGLGGRQRGLCVVESCVCRHCHLRISRSVGQLWLTSPCDLLRDVGLSPSKSLVNLSSNFYATDAAPSSFALRGCCSSTPEAYHHYSSNIPALYTRPSCTRAPTREVDSQCMSLRSHSRRGCRSIIDVLG